MNSIILQLIILLATSDADELNDSELAIRIKNGDHQAFKDFFERYNTFLLNFLMKRGTSKEAAKDLVQQAFVMIWEKKSSIDENKSLRSYLFGIAYTRMLNLFRDHNKFSAEVDPENVESTYIQHPEIEEQQEKSKQICNIIEQAISSMPKKRQEVFRMCFIQEFTYQETAEVLKVSKKTIENHMALALKDLRNLLKNYR